MLKRSPVFIHHLFRWIIPPMRFFFGGKIEGLEKIPPGPCVIIANHNIGAALEILLCLDNWEKYFRGERPLYGLTHNFAMSPLFRGLFARLGGVPATFEAGARVLAAGHALAIFPGGIREALRPYSQRYRAELGGHLGWARIALRAGVPVVALSIAGSHHVNPVLLRSRVLANLLVLPRLIGLKLFPLSLSQILFSSLAFAIAWRLGAREGALFLAYLTFALSPLLPCRPHPIRYLVSEPIDLAYECQSFRDEDTRARRAYEIVSEKIQSGMEQLFLKNKA